MLKRNREAHLKSVRIQSHHRPDDQVEGHGKDQVLVECERRLAEITGLGVTVLREERAIRRPSEEQQCKHEIIIYVNIILLVCD